MSVMPVVYSFARSGGTLANQLLGVHPDCLVLSEVNPAASVKSVAAQAAEWLGLAAAPEELSALPYREQVRKLSQRALEAGKRLVIRDWVTVNFLAGTSAQTAPSGELEQALYLEAAGFEMKPVVIARRSDAVLASIRRSFPHLAQLEADRFAESYARYAHAVRSFPVLRLEDLRARPLATLLDLLRALDLDATAAQSLLRDFGTFRNCTGNTTLKSPGASSNAREIIAPEAPGAAGEASPAMLEADRLFGYAG